MNKDNINLIGKWILIIGLAVSAIYFLAHDKDGYGYGCAIAGYWAYIFID